MIVSKLPRKPGHLLLALVCAVSAHAGQTDISTMPLNTYSAPSSTDVKPNVLFVLDDSGSMDWNYMPDWANDRPPNYSSLPTYLTKNSAFNGVAYNAAVTYTPPVMYNADGTQDTTTYPSQTSAATSGWTAVKNDGYGVQSNTTSNLVNNAYFYTVVAGEYCDSPSLRNCVTSNVPTGSYTYPAKLRWCSSGNLSTCRASWYSNNKYPRIPAPRTATITVAGATSTSVAHITVNGQKILSGATTASSTASTVASDIATNINNCSNSLSGNCTVAGYTATSSGAVVTIFAPGASSDTPIVTPGTGSMTFTATAFARGAIPDATLLATGGTTSSTVIPGENLRTAITSSVTSYPYPGTNAKAATRTDCAGTTCTYAEEMTNYANWWAYYHTRMQMMKTAATNAFSKLDSDADVANGVSRFRVGYLSINNNTNSDFLNIGEFKTSQKRNWYLKLVSANPNNSTPLRAALADAGRLYAGKLTDTTLNGSTVTDPLQYSCQQNYTILSTDGFWNSGAGYKMDGTTAVGNQDAALPRPYNDGGTATLQRQTSTLQRQTTQWTSQTMGVLQRQVSQVTSSTSQILQSTSNDRGRSWSDWSPTSSCTKLLKGNNQTQCQTVTTGPTPMTSCTDVPASSANNYTATTCGTTVISPFANVSTCAVTTTPDANGYTTQCRYAWQATAGTSICSPAYAPNDYSNPTVYKNCARVDGPWVNATSCTVNTAIDANGITTQCQYTGWTAGSNVTSCTAVSQSASPNYTVGTAIQCQSLPSGGTSDTLSDVAAYYYNTDLRDPDAGRGTGTCTGPTIPPATTANDLCANNVPASGLDVASTQHMTTFTLGLGAQGQMVYSPTYWNDQSGDFYDVKQGTTANPTSGICSWQSSGQCNWPTPASDSINNIDDLWHAAVNGHGAYFSATDPSTLSGALSSTLTTIMNTPRPGTAAAAASSNPNISTTDNYVFSSSYKSVEWYGELIRQQLSSTGQLSSQQWSAMQLLDCATTPWQAAHNYVAGNIYKNGSTCYLVATDYASGDTFGTTDTGNTTVITGSPVTRTIYTQGGSGLIAFQWSSLSATQQAYFTKPHIAGLSQFCATGGTCLNSTQQNNDTIATGGAAGEALVNFLRGDRSQEGNYYRVRVHVLGDIVSSEARYVKAPLFNYTDAGYSDFKTLNASRTGTVYVAANDGMLHAFDASNGQERWAYIPSLVLPNIYKLADTNYSANHQYFVDNSPETGDICPTAPTTACADTEWRTILVGGLNRGGKGYYALDITDPANPALLWEFTDPNLGYTYGNPKITKLKNGTWVVIFASGYNNVDGASPGVGRLYVLNASTGVPIDAMSTGISTGVGTSATPSGLARISAHALAPMTDNTTVAVYGGDLLGNLWRFDVNGDIGAAGYDAQLLVTFKDASGRVQPVTAKPVVTTVNGRPVVYAGTGRYLGVTDVADTNPQTFYAVVDRLDATTYGNPRGLNSGFIAQTLTAGTCPNNAPSSICSPGQAVRTSSSNAVSLGTHNGWYVDFPTGGERSTTDATLALGSLVFTTIAPQRSSVNVCGDNNTDASASFAYALDYLTGGAVTTAASISGVSLGSGLVTRPVLVEQADGTVWSLIRTSGGGGDGTDLGITVTLKPPMKPSVGSGLRRVSWRELNME
ncbi:MAG: Type fimbrial biosis protein PilY1 [Rhodocyclaceae bacterium]|nr:Type fimbrial biosis protein PilY1 [Rhodocyclaceae bacterium]